MSPVPDVQSLIQTVRDDATGDQPLDLLAQAARSAAALEEVTDALLGHYVEFCRANGCSWSQISAVLGVTKQAVHKRFSGGTPTYDRFTMAARAVLRDAPEQARARGRGSAGTEDLLLALFEPAKALAALVLREAGLSRAAVDAQLSADQAGAGEVNESQMSAGPVTGTIGYSPEARAVLRGTLDHALAMGHNYIGTEHLLLALFDDPGAAAARIMTSLGVSQEDLKARLVIKLEAIRQARESTA